jgi:hypothetical protein
MLIVDMSEVKLPGEAKQNNLPPEREQPIDASDYHCNSLLTSCGGAYLQGLAVFDQIFMNSIQF